MARIAIIGAGLCGLRCAEVLHKYGVSVQLFDKSRGLGGRLATRRHQHWRFDHGCPSLHGDGVDWQQRINHYPQWDNHNESEIPRLPSLGINQLAKDLGESLNVHRDCPIESIEQQITGWTLTSQQGMKFEAFDHLIVTIPPPQARQLLSGTNTALVGEIEDVRMAPSWVMMCVSNRSLIQRAEHYPTDSFIQRITAEHSKPGRSLSGGEYAYVLEATPLWSTQHEETDAATIEQHLTKELARITQEPVDLIHAATHRWRYARTQQPLGVAFLSDSNFNLSLAGDWCLGNGAESAYFSGNALAHKLLEDGAIC